MPDDPRRKWTVMIYLAGDNNLETYGGQDLREVKAVGSTEEVAAVAQFDRMSDQITRRYYFTRGQSLDADCVARLPEVNTGDPKALLDFLLWACQTYPAERYALVLWNHGAGWKDEDVYRAAREGKVVDKVTRGQVRGLAAGKASRSLFRPTLEQLVVEAAQSQRAILFDDSAADFLDSQELKQVLDQARQRLGRPFDLLGFDACLMSMLEVFYQVKDACYLAVGSQENEPGNGWPYDTILARLVAQPDMTPEMLGQVIVEAYVQFYQRHHPDLAVTQSAVRLNGIELVAGAVDSLGQALRRLLADRTVLGLLFAALRMAQTFSDRDYVDLIHFCQLLASSDPPPEIGRAAQRVVELLHGEGSPLTAAGRHGVDVTNASGLSIYLPVRVLSPLYKRLMFAQRYQWDEFLATFVHPV